MRWLQQGRYGEIVFFGAPWQIRIWRVTEVQLFFFFLLNFISTKKIWTYLTFDRTDKNVLLWLSWGHKMSNFQYQNNLPSNLCQVKFQEGSLKSKFCCVTYLKANFSHIMSKKANFLPIWPFQSWCKKTKARIWCKIRFQNLSLKFNFSV